MMREIKPLVYKPPQGPLCIVYQDEDLLVLSKPAGLLSVPGRPADCADSLQSRAAEAFPGALLVHRLDMDTSGIVVMARNRRAQGHLGKQFEKRQVEKSYVARVWGCVEGDRGRVDLPLRCDWPNRPRQMVCYEHGRPAQTDWYVVGRDAVSTRLKLVPLTGRSHQLRVHMLALGHPILGDDFYACDAAYAAAARLQLHAESLILRHPADGRRMVFFDPCPF